MAQTTPTTEPLSFTAGDTVAWTKSLADYSAADGWVLNYRLINAAGKIDIVSSASGSDHAVNVAASTTANYSAGIYSWQAFVTKASDRYTVGTGTLEISPNLAAEATGFDSRSPAQKCLDELNTAFATYGNKAYTQSYSIAGRAMTFNSPGDFLAFRSKVQQEVNREVMQVRVRNGMSARNKTTVGF